MCLRCCVVLNDSIALFRTDTPDGCFHVRMRFRACFCMRSVCLAVGARVAHSRFRCMYCRPREGCVENAIYTLEKSCV